jgi:hypothetical protein
MKEETSLSLKRDTYNATTAALQLFDVHNFIENMLALYNYSNLDVEP